MLKNKKKNREEEPSPGNTAQNEAEQELKQDNGTENPVSDNQNPDENTGEPAAAKPSEEEKLRADLSEANDKYLRLYAEFDNFKRRTTKERIDLLQTAGKDVLQSLLPVLDDFERALKSMESASDVAAVKEGINLVHSKLKNILVQKGLKEMESIGSAFDADLHEAITNIPAPSDEMKGKVIDEVEKGYFLNDKVIRFAKVVVGN
ncbi:nucleotide exchange factor GrpE [Arcticibacter tournemirensis]|uniref:Protein GrpE n=3 Tax=Arcticibacter tournemirensis TaxID=699437 RepID=A0A4Q0MBR0_9SPHI|nr:nucleotide exchange factor GrpE [Arcticibacter tournemirensis]KAA8485079.1 nucleotide exchange factor GrpE [Arcticibacter tournemirensis]RXF70747.1 nucleotide exchange factor GrpE [Arcticibacter tournemirensis]